MRGSHDGATSSTSMSSRRHNQRRTGASPAACRPFSGTSELSASVVWALLVVFCLSLLFPIVASTLVAPISCAGHSRLAVAAVFAIGATMLVARPRVAVTDADRLRAHRWTEWILTVVPVLLAVFLVAGAHVNWTVLVIGLAWRLWLFVSCLPYLVAAMRSLPLPRTSH